MHLGIRLFARRENGHIRTCRPHYRGRRRLLQRPRRGGPCLCAVARPRACRAFVGCRMERSDPRRHRLLADRLLVGSPRGAGRGGMGLAEGGTILGCAAGHFPLGIGGRDRAGDTVRLDVLHYFMVKFPPVERRLAHDLDLQFQRVQPDGTRHPLTMVGPSFIRKHPITRSLPPRLAWSRARRRYEPLSPIRQ